MVNSIAGIVGVPGAAAEKLRYFNDITAQTTTVTPPSFVDFLLTIMHSTRLDSVKGATNDNSSFDFQQP
jgi:hypothetical protein